VQPPLPEPASEPGPGPNPLRIGFPQPSALAQGGSHLASGLEYFQAGQPFEIGDIAVSPFTIPHDAADPVGFVFRAEGVRMGFATDLGYIPPNVKSQLQGVDLLLLESNHDLEMLRDGPYPWAVKQRVLSRVGHLSNEAAAQFLENDYDGQAAYVILAHLSESNNLPELGAGHRRARACWAGPASWPIACCWLRSMSHFPLSIFRKKELQ
jgi:phosphoribosyl 1,2-cyclic phosphodiesterase